MYINPLSANSHKKQKEERSIREIRSIGENITFSEEKMKACVILMLVICAAVIVEQSEAKKDKIYLSPHIFDPCHGPNPPAGCHPPHDGPPVPANKYTRGCLKIHRCRGGG